jgi:hypothetical protein
VSEFAEILDMHDRCQAAVHRATSTWAPGMTTRQGCTRCPGCAQQTLHYTRGAEITYACETLGCPTRELRARAVRALGGR